MRAGGDLGKFGSHKTEKYEFSLFVEKKNYTELQNLSRNYLKILIVDKNISKFNF